MSNAMMDGISNRLTMLGREEKDRSTIPVMEDWANEHEMLRYHWALLDEYSKAKDMPNEVTLKAEECRYRQYLISCLEATISRNGCSADARDFIENQIRSGNLRNPPGFDSWWKKHKAFLSSLPHQVNQDSKAGLKRQYKCFDIRCHHYAYGFETVEDQERHVNEHLRLQRRLSPSRDVLISGSANGPEFQDFRAYDLPLSPEGNDHILDQDLSLDRDGFMLSRASHQEHSTVPLTSSMSRDLVHRRASPQDISSTKPCLRCRILKKGCDYRDPCKECPTQELNSSDYWKALGCFHDNVVDLVNKCLPERLTKSHRAYEYEPHRALSIESAFSEDGELKRRDTAIYVFLGNSVFPDLEDGFWEDIRKRNKLANQFGDVMKMGNLPEQSDTTSFEGLEIPLGLLNLGYLDPVYLEKTAYNPFSLLTIGNRLAAQPENYTSNPWAIFLQAKALLCDVLAMYKQERQTYNMITNLRLDSSNPKPYRLLLPDVRRSLSMFLSCFDLFFSQRVSLTAQRWLDAFYAIAMFSMAKSLLIDTFSLRDEQERPSPWRASDAIQIGSVYKAVVSIFIWSAKVNSWCPNTAVKARDPLMVDWNLDQPETIHPISIRMRKALFDTQKLTRQASWKQASILSSKDYLMLLGTGDFLDLGCNGFLPKRYRSGNYRKVYQEVPHRKDLLSRQSAVIDSALSPKQSTAEIGSTNARTPPVNKILALAAPESIGLHRSSKPIAAGIERSATYPPTSPVRQLLPVLRERYLPQKRDFSTANDSIGDREEWPRNYSTPSRVNSDPVSRRYDLDNRNETLAINLDPALTVPHRKSMAEGVKRRPEQHSCRLNRDQIPYAGRNLIRASSSRPENQEQAENSESEIALRSNDQGPSKRARNLSEEAPQPRSGSVIMTIDPDAVRNAPEPQGLKSSTGVFSIIREVSSEPRPARKTFTKEQREQIAQVRKIGACAACKAKKVKCSIGHPRA